MATAELLTDWPAQLTVLLLAVVAAAMAGVGIWAARSERHWFWRALAIWACVAAFVRIRAYEPAMVLAVGLPLLVLLLTGRRIFDRLASGAAGLRFGLADAGLLVVIVGLSLAVLRTLVASWPEVTAYSIFVPAALFAAMAGVARWIAVGPGRWWAICGAVLVVSAAPWLVFPKVSWLLKIEPLGLYYYETMGDLAAYRRGLATAFLLASLFVCLVIGLCRAARHQRGGNTSRFGSMVRRVSLAVVLVAFAGLYIAMLRLAPFPPALVSEDDQGAKIAQIIEQVQSLNDANSSGGNAATLSSLPADKAAALSALYREIETLLAGTNSMPFDPERDSTDLYFRTTHTDRVTALRNMRRCFQAEWKEADARGDRQRSLDLTIACVRLGMVWCRNGLMVDCLVGHAVLGSAYAHLIELRKSLSPDEAEQVIAAIRRVEAEHEAIERILERDIAFCERAFGWQARFSRVMDFRGENEESARSVRVVVQRWRAMSRLLITEIAIDQFQREHGALPGELGELVPEYLEAVPIDPFSEQPLVYRLADDGFVLYSVGQDGVDNGGKLPSGPEVFQDGFDLDLEARSR